MTFLVAVVVVVYLFIFNWKLVKYLKQFPVYQKYVCSQLK